MQTQTQIDLATGRELPINLLSLHKAGVFLGTLVAGCHLLWIVLVSAGWAQPLIDFVFWAHMVQPIYVIKAFDLRAALILLGMTFASGYALGFIGAILWNKLRSEK